MSRNRKTHVLSIRTGEDILACIESFRRAQLTIPTQTEALRALVRLGFERWKEREGALPVLVALSEERRNQIA